MTLQFDATNWPKISIKSYILLISNEIIHFQSVDINNEMFSFWLYGKWSLRRLQKKYTALPTWVIHFTAIVAFFISEWIHKKHLMIEFISWGRYGKKVRISNYFTWVYRQIITYVFSPWQQKMNSWYEYAFQWPLGVEVVWAIREK